MMNHEMTRRNTLGRMGSQPGNRDGLLTWGVTFPAGDLLFIFSATRSFSGVHTKLGQDETAINSMGHEISIHTYPVGYPVSRY